MKLITYHEMEDKVLSKQYEINDLEECLEIFIKTYKRMNWKK